MVQPGLLELRDAGESDCGLCRPFDACPQRGPAASTRISLCTTSSRASISPRRACAGRSSSAWAPTSPRGLCSKQIRFPCFLPGYRKILVTKYAVQNVLLGRHGTFASAPGPPDFSKRGNPEHRILAIGHWGTYKRLETLMEAFPAVLKEIPNAKLIVAGANHHTKAGYWESIREAQPAASADRVSRIRCGGRYSRTLPHDFRPGTALRLGDRIERPCPSGMRVRGSHRRRRHRGFSRHGCR